MIAVGADERATALRFASSITSAKHDPVAVVRNYLPMLDWLKQATSDDDLDARLAALNQMWCNLPDFDDRGPLLDAPAAFVAGADIFYLVVTADDDPPDDARSLTGGDS